MKARLQQHFDQGLGAIAGSLPKKGGAKSYEGVGGCDHKPAYRAIFNRIMTIPMVH
ncbi:MAG: hypothetical protein Q8R28_20775 [Dehalococcoidia bacterium]|nr:hypothetical protein [Dehalococcoidia bacterium]